MGNDINCLVSQVLHIDVSEDYGAGSVVKTIRKFASLQGTPAKIHSDKGFQLLSGSEELSGFQYLRKVSIEMEPVNL